LGVEVARPEGVVFVYVAEDRKGVVWGERGEGDEVSVEWCNAVVRVRSVVD
jgi:hypothetical protein